MEGFFCFNIPRIDFILWNVSYLSWNRFFSSWPKCHWLGIQQHLRQETQPWRAYSQSQKVKQKWPALSSEPRINRILWSVRGAHVWFFTIRTGLLHTGAWKEQKREKIVQLQARAALLLEISQRTSPVFFLPKQKGLTCCSLKGCKSLLLAQAVTRDKTAWKLLSKQLRGKSVTCSFLHKYAAETPLKGMTAEGHICRVLPVSAHISCQYLQVMAVWQEITDPLCYRFDSK